MSILGYLAAPALMALSALVFAAVGARENDDAPSALLAMLGGALLLMMQAALWVRVGMDLRTGLPALIP